MPDLITGDTVRIKVTLMTDGVAEDVSAASSITMKLRRGASQVGATTITCSSGTTGADWANGVVIGILDNTDSAQLTANDRVQIQVKVTTGGEPLSWITPLSDSIRIVTGV